MKPHGLSGAKASARAVLAGRIANGIAQAQRPYTPPLLRARRLRDRGDTPSCRMGRKERSSMSSKTDFTPEEWETLRNAPYLAAAAVMVAGRSGILGSIKEALVIAQTFYESASSESPLIKALSAQDEVKLSQEFVSNQIALREADQAPEK